MEHSRVGGEGAIRRANQESAGWTDSFLHIIDPGSPLSLNLYIQPHAFTLLPPFSSTTAYNSQSCSRRHGRPPQWRCAVSCIKWKMARQALEGLTNVLSQTNNRPTILQSRECSLHILIVLETSRARDDETWHRERQSASTTSNAVIERERRGAITKSRRYKGCHAIRAVCSHYTSRQHMNA